MVPQGDDGEETYDVREAVAVFDTEASLQATIDDLMQIGFRREDMSLLAEAKALPRCSVPQTVQQLEDKDNVLHSDYVSPDARTEGMAALVALPMYAAGAGAAAVAMGAAALIPTIAVVAGSGVAAGALGLMLARVVGHRHAMRVQQQIANGGLLLWVHVPDKARDSQVVEILKRHGGRDVHFHTVRRTWGVADVPLHDVNPDPLL